MQNDNPAYNGHSITVDGVGTGPFVIVVTASSDEVAKIIRQRFDRNINIAILRDYGLEAV